MAPCMTPGYVVQVYWAVKKGSESSLLPICKSTVVRKQLISLLFTVTKIHARNIREHWNQLLSFTYGIVWSTTLCMSLMKGPFIDISSARCLSNKNIVSVLKLVSNVQCARGVQSFARSQ